MYNEENRISLQNALDNKNYKRAFEKINENISKFCLNIQKLQDYSFKIGSKSDNIENSKKIDSLIIETGDLISETFDLLKIIQDFKYNKKNEKIENITEANSLEDKCNSLNKQFEDITNKIQKQNLNIIERVKSSFRFSTFSNTDMPIYDENNYNNENEFNNGKQFLDGIKSKKKQNAAIEKANHKIQASMEKISFKSSNSNSNKYNNNSDNSFKFNNNDNPFLINKNKINDSMELKIEKRIFDALNEPKYSFFNRNKKQIVLFIIFIIIIIIIIILYKFFI